jgi:hypothetical protein
MLNLTQATTVTPAPAPLPPAQPSVFEVNVQAPTRPLTQQEISIIRNQRSEMSDQLQSAQNRRERVLNEIRTAPAGTEAGLQQQYQVLSDRIVAIERDIEASGRTLRSGQVQVGTVIVPPRSFGPPSAADNAARGATWRRRGRGNRRHVEMTAEQDSRFERLEQAVDAIALEIERVGEAQRYQAKLLAEANMMPVMGVAQKSAEPVRAREFDR